LGGFRPLKPFSKKLCLEHSFCSFCGAESGFVLVPDASYFSGIPSQERPANGTGKKAFTCLFFLFIQLILVSLSKYPLEYIRHRRMLDVSSELISF